MPDGMPRPRVLLADGSADVRDRVCRLLADWCEVEAVADGEAALVSALAGPPDVVLLDALVLGLDGFRLAKALRADPRTRGAQLVLLAACAGGEAAAEELDAAVDDHLAKPFPARELVARVRVNVAFARLRRRAADELRASEERLRVALETGRLGSWQLDPATGALSVSEGCKANFGRAARAEFTYADLLEAVHPGDRDRQRATLADAVASGSDYDVEFRTIWPDGSEHRVRMRGQATYGRDGAPLRVAGVSLDVTDRERVEAALRESEDEHRHAVVLNLQVPWTADPEGSITGFSRRWLDLKPFEGAALERAVADLARRPAAAGRWDDAAAPGRTPAAVDSVAPALVEARRVETWPSG